jgi:hypothetical protein
MKENNSTMPQPDSLLDAEGTQNLPNANAVLVLGIISLPTILCYGVVGLICGIIALALSAQSMRMYKANPDMYSKKSYNNLNAGRICAIIGTILSALFLFLIIVMVALWGTIAASFFDAFGTKY